MLQKNGSEIRENQCFDTDLNTSRDLTGKRNRIWVNISTLLTRTDANADDDDDDDGLLQSEIEVILLEN